MMTLDRSLTWVCTTITECAGARGTWYSLCKQHNDFTMTQDLILLKINGSREQMKKNYLFQIYNAEDVMVADQVEN